MFNLPLKWFKFSQLHSGILNCADETFWDLIARRRDQNERKIKFKGQRTSKQQHTREKGRRAANPRNVVLYDI